MLKRARCFLFLALSCIFVSGWSKCHGGCPTLLGRPWSQCVFGLSTVLALFLRVWLREAITGPKKKTLLWGRLGQAQQPWWQTDHLHGMPGTITKSGIQDGKGVLNLCRESRDWWGLFCAKRKKWRPCYLLQKRSRHLRRPSLMERRGDWGQPQRCTIWDSPRAQSSSGSVACGGCPACRPQCHGQSPSTRLRQSWGPETTLSFTPSGFNRFAQRWSKAHVGPWLDERRRTNALVVLDYACLDAFQGHIPTSSLRGAWNRNAWPVSFRGYSWSWPWLWVVYLFLRCTHEAEKMFVRRYAHFCW